MNTYLEVKVPGVDDVDPYKIDTHFCSCGRCVTWHSNEFDEVFWHDCWRAGDGPLTCDWCVPE